MALGVALPTSQALGRSASICERLIVVTVPAGSAPSPAPLPCVAAPACAAASASLPSASAEARLDRRRIEQDESSAQSALMQTATTLSANSEKARENVASLGSRPAPAAQPPSNLKTLDQKSNTALAMKARASAARSSSGRPTWPRK